MSHVITGLKIVVSLLILGWIFSKTDVATIWYTVQHFDLAYLIPALMLALLGILLSVWKWTAIVKTLSGDTSFGSLLKIFWIGLFFNNLLPGRTGGDVIRIYGLSQMNHNNLKSTLSVVFDRSLNLVALVVIGAIAFYPHASIWAFQWTSSYMGYGIGVCVLPLLLLFVPRIKTFVKKQMQSVFQTLKMLTGIQLVTFLALAFLYQTTMILNHVFIAKGLGQHIAIAHFFYLIPLTALTTLLPISLNGWGIREGTFVVAFTHVGLTSEDAIALSLMATFLTMIISLVGGILYISHPLKQSPQATPISTKQAATC